MRFHFKRDSGFIINFLRTIRLKLNSIEGKTRLEVSFGKAIQFFPFKIQFTITRRACRNLRASTSVYVRNVLTRTACFPNFRFNFNSLARERHTRNSKFHATILVLEKKKKKDNSRNSKLLQIQFELEEEEGTINFCEFQSQLLLSARQTSQRILQTHYRIQPTNSNSLFSLPDETKTSIFSEEK